MELVVHNIKGKATSKKVKLITCYQENSITLNFHFRKTFDKKKTVPC